MQSNRREARSDIAIYNKIKEIVNAHLHYLKEHKSQLLKIELNQHIGNGIGEAEAIEYFKDTIGVTPEESGLSRKKYLQRLKTTLNCRLVMFDCLSKICSNEASEKNLLLLYFMLDYCNKQSKFIAREIRRRGNRKQHIVEGAFNENEHLSHLSRQLKKIVPESHSSIAKAIIIQTEVAIVSNHLNGSHNHLDKIQLVEIASNQSNFLKLYSDVVSALNQKKIKLFPEEFGSEIPDKIAIHILNKQSEIFSFGSESFKKLPNPTGLEDTQAVRNALIELTEKIDAILTIKYVLDTLRTTYNNEQKLQNDKTETFKLLVKKSSVVLGQVDNVCKSKHHKIIAKSLQLKLQSKKDELNSALQSFNNIDYINHTTWMSQQDLIKSIVDQIKILLVEAKKATCQTASHATTSKDLVKSTPTPTKPIRKGKSERLLYFEKRQKMDEKWRNEVREKREIKERQSLESSSSSGSTPSLSSSPSPSLSSTSSSSSPIISLFSNKAKLTLDMQSKKQETLSDKLLHLSRNNLELILKILANEKGVAYREVIALITNQLGGAVHEIGNGSSHKRIKLESLYFEVNSKNIDANQPSPSPSVVTGGMYKPHGKSHNSGYMSAFNLKLVSDAFIKAGITPDIIHHLYDEKIKQNSRKI